MNLHDLKRLQNMVAQAIDLYPRLIEMSADEKSRFRRLYGEHDLVLGGEFAVTHLMHPCGYQVLSRPSSGSLSVQIEKQD